MGREKRQQGYKLHLCDIMMGKQGESQTHDSIKSIHSIEDHGILKCKSASCLLNCHLLNLFYCSVGSIRYNSNDEKGILFAIWPTLLLALK